MDIDELRESALEAIDTLSRQAEAMRRAVAGGKFYRINPAGGDLVPFAARADCAMVRLVAVIDSASASERKQ